MTKSKETVSKDHYLMGLTKAELVLYCEGHVARLAELDFQLDSMRELVSLDEERIERARLNVAERVVEILRGSDLSKKTVALDLYDAISHLRPSARDYELPF